MPARAARVHPAAQGAALIGRRRRMATSTAAAMVKVREICLALPEACETRTWGSPHFRVREKIFAGADDHAPRPSIGLKLSLERQAQMLRDPRFTVAPYVGKHGWVTMDLGEQKDWAEVRDLVIESYCAIAPKKLAAQITGVAIRRKRVRTSTKRATRPADD